jgi:hypothetical protein
VSRPAAGGAQPAPAESGSVRSCWSRVGFIDGVQVDDGCGEAWPTFVFDSRPGLNFCKQDRLMPAGTRTDEEVLSGSPRCCPLLRGLSSL